MWKYFTEVARKAAWAAQDAAIRLGRDDVDADLILLGCIAVNEPVAMKTLADFGYPVSYFQAGTEAQVKKRSKGKPDKVASLSPEGRRVVERAYALMKERDEKVIRVEHLVLGVAEEPTSFLATAREERRRHLAQTPPETDAPEPSPFALSARLAGMQPLDALAVITIREIKLTVSLEEANRLQALLDDVDRVFEVLPTHSGSNPIAETMADAVHLASERRDPLVAAHLLAAMYRRTGSAVSEVGRRHYATVEEMLDRLVPGNR